MPLQAIADVTLPPIATKLQPFENRLTVNAHIICMAIHLSVNFQYIQSILKISHFCRFHCNGSHFENFKVKSLIITCQLTIISSFIKFKAFWEFLTFLQFPWQRLPFWKFQSQKSHPDLAVNNNIKFHQFWSILKFLKYLILYPW